MFGAALILTELVFVTFIQYLYVNKKIGSNQLIVDMQERGEHATVELEPKPSKDSAQYKKFIAANYGQWVQSCFTFFTYFYFVLVLMLGISKI